MITVKLYAYLRDNRGKSVELVHQEGMTIKDVAKAIELNLDDVSIVICDGKDDIPSRMVDYPVQPDSLIHFFPPVAGG